MPRIRRTDRVWAIVCRGGRTPKEIFIHHVWREKLVGIVSLHPSGYHQSDRTILPSCRISRSFNAWFMTLCHSSRIASLAAYKVYLLLVLEAAW